MLADLRHLLVLEQFGGIAGRDIAVSWRNTDGVLLVAPGPRGSRDAAGDVMADAAASG